MVMRRAILLLLPLAQGIQVKSDFAPNSWNSVTNVIHNTFKSAAQTAENLFGEPANKNDLKFRLEQQLENERAKRFLQKVQLENKMLSPEQSRSMM